MFNRAGKFLNEVKTEMKKVSWSTKKELMASTWIVLISVFLLTLFIGIVDFVVSQAVNKIIQ